MARALIGVFLASTAIPSLTGCGTLLNLPEQPGYFHLDGACTRRVYGGTRLDAALAAKAMAGAFTDDDLEFGRVGTFGIGAYALFIDLPLSAVADSLTLPYVLYHGPGKTFRDRLPPSELKALEGKEGNLPQSPPPSTSPMATSR